jgi:hypothetical protein
MTGRTRLSPNVVSDATMRVVTNASSVEESRSTAKTTSAKCLFPNIAADRSCEAACSFARTRVV